MRRSVTSFEETRDGFEVLASIDDLEELFVAPKPDPFEGRVRTKSVVEEIVSHARSRSLRRPISIRLTIALPSGGRGVGLKEKEVEEALRSYAAAKLHEVEESIRVNRFEGLARLPWGALVAVAVILLALAVHALLPQAAKPLLGVVTPLLTVLIWVAIWIPIEYLLYESWTLERVKKAYVALHENLSVEALVSEPHGASDVLP